MRKPKINFGAYAESKVQTEAIRKGYIVSIPVIDTRYDLLLDDKINIIRVQIKYVNRKANSGSVCLCLCRDIKYKKQYYTSKQIDLLLVYIPKIDKILAFGPKYFHNKNGITIRYEKSKRFKKTRNEVWAEDFVW